MADRQRLLEEQISDARRTISSDGYPISIGELTNIYKEDELVIRPEFQRFFRWTETQKSRLIESILLGIPIPSIFVAQTTSGTWELIDGLQRVSTILQLQGELIGPDGQLVDALVLHGTKYLPALDGKVWEGPDPWNSLSDAQKLDVKRAKLDVKIIKRESSAETKYDLFQRLNSYGTSLTAQEVRSALLVAVSPEFFSWLEGLAAYEPFVSSTMLSDRLIDERFDIELVLRFLLLHNRPESKLTLGALRDFSQVIDDESVEMAKSFPDDQKRLETVFKATFDHVQNNGSEKVFRRWDVKAADFRGSFLNTAFEVFALGTGYQLANSKTATSKLIDSVKEFWTDLERGYATGKSTEARLVRFVPLGRELTAT